MTAQVMAASIFVVSLFLIFSERINRTIVSSAGAVLMVSVGTLIGFYSDYKAIEAIDFNTLGLLLGMMILVALVEPTGFFQFVAVWAGRLSRGRPVLLLVLMGTVTTVISMFLDNVTTVVLIAPITILICEILGIQPIPYLMAEAILSDTGGVSTLVGDPPNVLIASAAGFTFNTFLTHALPIVLVAWLVVLGLLRYLFRKELSEYPKNTEVLLELDPRESLEDWKMARRVLIVLAGAILLFLLEDFLQISPAFVALSSAAVALVWIRPDVRDLFRRIDWSILIFFVSLFVMVGGLEASGVLRSVVLLLEHLNEIPPMLFGVILIWVVALLSAVVDNVPITIALIPVVQGLGANGMNIQPLWWALAFGAGFGGNGTIIGSTANIVVVSLSERTHTPITSKIWNKRGLPAMLATCFVASLLFILFYPLLSR